MDPKNNISYFIIARVDRFSRNVEVQFKMSRMLEGCGVYVRSASEVIDETPVGKMTMGMTSLFAQYDNEVRAERVKAGLARRASEGIWVWTTPLGYLGRGAGVTITPDPKTAPLVKRAFEEFAKGQHSIRSLAKLIAGWGLKSCAGKKLQGQALANMLRNPIYYGKIRTNGNIYQGIHEPVIEERVYKNCKKILDGRLGTPTPKLEVNTLFPLRRLLICSECETPLTGSECRGRGGKKYPYYHHHRQGCEKARFISKEEVETLFAEYMRQVAPERGLMDLFSAIVTDVWKEKTKETSRSNEDIKRAVERLKLDRQRIFDLHRKGVYSDEIFVDQKCVNDERIAHEEGKTMQEMHAGVDLPVALEHCQKVVGNISKTWKSAKYEVRQRIQRTVFRAPVPFDGMKFGTAQKSLIFELKWTPLDEESTLVGPGGFEPPTPTL